MFALLLALMFPPAHPLHTSAAEIELHPRSREVVVTIRVYSDDLEAELGGAQPHADVVAWLRRGFLLRSGDGAAIELDLVARRRVADMQHFTLRTRAGATLQGLSVHHTLFFGRFADQLNLVRFRHAGRARMLLFTPGDGPAALH